MAQNGSNVGVNGEEFNSKISFFIAPKCSDRELEKQREKELQRRIGKNKEYLEHMYGLCANGYPLEIDIPGLKKGKKKAFFKSTSKKIEKLETIEVPEKERTWKMDGPEAYEDQEIHLHLLSLMMWSLENGQIVETGYVRPSEDNYAKAIQDEAVLASIKRVNDLHPEVFPQYSISTGRVWSDDDVLLWKLWS